jgi:transcriptional regulator with XRE-family HTH domain
MFNAKKFGMRLSYHRRHLVKISLSEAGKILGCSGDAISRIERGEKPDIDTFAKICIWGRWSANDFFAENPADLDDF